MLRLHWSHSPTLVSHHSLSSRSPLSQHVGTVCRWHYLMDIRWLCYRYCDKCERWFGSYKSLKQHIEDSNEHNACRTCGFDGDTWAELARHIDSRHSCGGRTCYGCSTVFWSHQDYWDHIEDDNVCTICNKHFNTTNGLRQVSQQWALILRISWPSYSTKEHTYHHLHPPRRLHQLQDLTSTTPPTHSNVTAATANSPATAAWSSTSNPAHAHQTLTSTISTDLLHSAINGHTSSIDTVIIEATSLMSTRSITMNTPSTALNVISTSTSCQDSSSTLRVPLVIRHWMIFPSTSWGNTFTRDMVESLMGRPQAAVQHLGCRRKERTKRCC